FPVARLPGRQAGAPVGLWEAPNQKAKVVWAVSDTVPRKATRVTMKMETAIPSEALLTRLKMSLAMTDLQSLLPPSPFLAFRVQLKTGVQPRTRRKNTDRRPNAWMLLCLSWLPVDR
ncbi:hypothetical protein L345_17151, partial [Ophiophagus hannah]